MLTFSHVGYRFPSGTPGVHDVSLQVRPGERIALMGSNGSGKSTILRLACGIIQPSTGQVHRTRVAYVAQDPYANIVGETVEEDVKFAAMLQKVHVSSPQESIDAALDLVGMSQARHRTMNSLSGGAVQRVALATAIVSGAKLWILDEPTSHLPRSEARDFWNKLMHLVRVLGVSLLYATHYPQEVRYAHRVYCLSQGRIGLMGPPQALFRRPELLSPLGIRMDLGQALWPLLYRESSDLEPPQSIAEELDLDEKVARALCSAFDR